MQDFKIDELWVVYPGQRSYPLGKKSQSARWQIASLPADEERAGLNRPIVVRCSRPTLLGRNRASAPYIPPARSARNMTRTRQQSAVATALASQPRCASVVAAPLCWGVGADSPPPFPLSQLHRIVGQLYCNCPICRPLPSELASWLSRLHEATFLCLRPPAPLQPFGSSGGAARAAERDRAAEPERGDF